MIANLKKKRCSYTLILLLILLTFSGCGSSNSTPSNKGENSKGIIKGTVTAASSVVFKGKPLLPKTAFAGNTGVAGAVCVLEGTDNSVTTDASGFFQMSNVPAGSYILICKKTASEDGKVYAFLEIVEVQDGETVDLGTVDIKKTGGIQGKATLSDQTDHTGISVYIPGTSMQARTDATGAYLINDVPEGTYELHFEKSGYMTGKITGLPVIAGETAIAEDMSLSLSTGASGIISIENGKVYSNSRTVTVYFTTSDDARLYQISDNPNFIGAVWNTIPPSRTWIFDSDGEKRLYAKFADANGLESAPVSDSIIVDTTPPANGSIVINNNASATNSTTVTLTLSASDTITSVTQMKISNTPDFAGAEWESFVTTRSWTIPAGDGTKTVYVLFRDIVGNETAQAISDDIILDTTLPVNPSINIQEGGYTNNLLIHLNLSALEAANMNISEDPNFTSTQTISYNSTTVFTLSAGEGNKTIYAKFIDDAGNETSPVSVSTILDTTPPTTPIIFNQNQTTNQTTFTMILSTPSTDTNFKTYQLKGGQYADWTDTSEITTFSFTLTQAGENILSIRGKDLAGNTSNPASVILTLDSNNPVLSNISASVAATNTAISWETNEPTTGRVDYGLNEDYGLTIEDSLYTTNHVLSIPGLTPGTYYHFRITSSDAGGNVSASTDFTFMTLHELDLDYNWTMTIGGGEGDAGNAITLDSNNNIYITGYFNGTVDFDPSNGIDNKSEITGPNGDYFITKINSDGSYGWTNIIESNDRYSGNKSVVSDSTNNVYLTGRNISSDMIVTKYNSGGSIEWTKIMDGDGYQVKGTAITLDSNDNIYIIGTFYGTVDFDPGGGIDSKTSNGESDIFITKLNSNGSYGWTQVIGGPNYDFGGSITIDTNGNIYITGTFHGMVDFNPSAGVDSLTSSGWNDIFITKFNSTGGYIWTKAFYSFDGDNDVNNIVHDSNDNVYITGAFYSQTDFDPSNTIDNKTPNGSGDIFITKINSDGSYGQTKTIGGTGSDMGNLITADSSNNIYLIGTFSDKVEFDPSDETDNKISKGDWDIFITKYNSDGSYGGTATMGSTSGEGDIGNSIEIDSNGNLFITGRFFLNVDFDPTSEVDNKVSNGDSDIFISKFTIGD